MITFILIHIAEIIAILAYILIKKVRNLESVVLEQQQYIDTIGIVIDQANDRLKELDASGMFESDDEIGFFFENIKEIQSVLNDFNNKK
jgi:hypothetical protein